ncbi:MAG: flagellar basal body-associated FliL family protein [Gammaproteobacteria bacterium]|nr:flagellar basal body-associated FliL family protein [Gammaproteobacteria bacterium]MBT8150956.1 flagellar basal body-associated FliL family protein [Gammaproteobacteria bacterium]NND38309.1 flagellar basal body-associated protein FliL [Pseudomonadales bacterium]NNL11751.1 flagellar basal body-associated protein FliL [Pseudomonadales bacterium]NNM11463.1 flagellar basal body-associated protein FliL [Pseudomonadales bacterium]
MMVYDIQAPWQRGWLVLLLSAIVLGMGAAPAYAEDEEEGESAVSRYVEIKPPFVTNYGSSARLRYMKVQVTLRVLGGAGESQVNRHMPYIKDTLLSLFAVQTRESIGSAEGKEALRKQSLEAVSKILEQEDKASHVEDLLFTSFVAHR